MANQISVVDKVANMALAEFRNNNSMTMTASREYQDQFSDAEYQIGDSLRIRRQNHYVVNDGRISPAQDTLERTETLVIDHQYNTRIQFTSKELTLDTTKDQVRFNERYVRPAIQEIVHQMETDIALQGIAELNYASGTPGTPINSFAAIREVRSKMLEQGMPVTSSPSYMALGIRSAGSLQSSLQNSFNDILNREISLDASLGRLSKFDIYENQAIPRHTAGNADGAPIVNGEVSSGNVINVSGLTASTGSILAGDVITVAGVESVNPVGRKSTGQLMQFVVVTGGVADGAGELVLTVRAIGGEIISDPNNPNRNVSVALPNGAAITVLGAGLVYEVNFAYCQRGLDIVCPPMQKVYTAGGTSVVTDKDANISLRLSKDGDQENDVNTFRLDVLCGYKWHPEYAIKLVA